MFREDLRDLTRVQDIDQLMTLSQILLSQAGAMVNYSSLANEVCVSRALKNAPLSTGVTQCPDWCVSSDLHVAAELS
jgi:hypothetical protein